MLKPKVPFVFFAVNLNRRIVKLVSLNSGKLFVNLNLCISNSG